MTEQRPTADGRAPVDSGSSEPSAPELELTAFRVGPGAPEIVPAPATRDWMDATPGRFAYRCLPLVVANQNGWVLLNPTRFRIMWNGSARSDGLRFKSDGGHAPPPVTSVFGSGIVTWRVPYLFRTPRGYDLIVRGPANLVKRGIVALDGLVETDWAVATFTMNWKITTPFRWIRFDRGEPFCMILPQRRDDLEAFRPEIRDLDTDPDLARSFREWVESRERFVFDRLQSPPGERRPDWQKDYFKGVAPSGASAAEHRVSLKVRTFESSDAADSGSGRASELWQHYARRATGWRSGASLASRLLSWSRFWLGALRS